MLLDHILIVLVDKVLLAVEDIRWVQLDLSTDGFNYLMTNRLLLILIVDDDNVILLIGRSSTLARGCLIRTVCCLSLNQHAISLLKRHFTALIFIMITNVLSLSKIRRIHGDQLLLME